VGQILGNEEGDSDIDEMANIEIDDDIDVDDDIGEDSSESASVSH